jgi:uncharacterized protein YbjT (DUF2867 family)
MNVLVFGATGMIGQGVLREALHDPGVERIVAVGRSASGSQHPKLRDVVVADVANLSSLEAELQGFDACFFCLGVSSAGMSERDYTRTTHDLTLAVATTLVRINPAMTFVYISGMGTDSTERGRSMWARIKGRTENALLRLPFKAAYMLRPGLIIPLHGVRSKTTWYRLFYAASRPAYPLLKALAPNAVTTIEQMGRAMLALARGGYTTRVLESRDINAL